MSESAIKTDAAAPRRSGRISALPIVRKRKAADDSGDELDSDDDAPAPKARSKKVKAVKPKPEINPGLELGATLPELTLKNQKDEDVEIAKLGTGEDKKGVILFLVPKADTPGCTTQACAFRDSYSDFTGFDVYCVSADKPAAQEKWQTKKSLPYPLLSDPSRSLISALGAGDGGKTKRSHFVFALDKESGKVTLVDKKNPVKAGDSAKLALEFIKTLS